MSTSVRQPVSASSLKQEVSQRLAAHRNRRGLSKANPTATAQSCAASGGRASLAARVAARYAHAPSFSQMQAAETVAPSAALPFDPGDKAGTVKAVDEQPEVVVRALEPATEYPSGPSQAAEKPIAEGDGGFNPRIKPRESTQASAPEEDFQPISPVSQSFSAAYEGHDDSAGVVAQMETSQHPFAVSPDAMPPLENRWEQPALNESAWDEEELAPVEPDLPIYANLIEFPRELVAPRKRRPQLAESPFAADGLEEPLSILSVDPGLLSSESEASAAPAWPEPEWSGIKLDAQPACEPRHQDESASRLPLHMAPISQRLMAVLVDGALITAAFLGATLVATTHIVHPPAVKVLELSAASAFLLVGLLYQACFFTLTEATPGMRYARISLCTFDGQIPTRAQLRSRLGALLLSVLPVGLGVVWALFDEDRLSWHDRLSRTYLRKN